MSNASILLIEDEVELCNIMKEQLQNMNYAVMSAHNGEDGLELIHDHEFDLIICDRAMPKMSGYDLLKRIRAVFPQYSDIPFIFLTALTDDRDKDAVAYLNPAAYLKKPVDFEALNTEIQKQLNAA